uniref:Predicted nuclease, contains PIN domain, potential toxin-antitoxin system component n=1 Tax=Candidatus Kentrum eta TaxID=2126337 RepID=A0A450UZ55_9GAMM|nr:MAG: Predicted nuclease, contains PIN domain, potential toxin-antitoxin system component [Candidatus Kentron sp. H]VFJ98550.1 MAG: Predicted nuclease, contains PIN domain, potential toxin-antitoxin system component [Candidatus Kentron sp. H]VFK03295.1 MAG: Predicted nuclease, contains PIN domain, potential toxin-antitoxin system component [Candidatus Kentron sp. H]
MKLLFDENISFRLADWVAREFPESNHIDLVRMRGSTDSSIWEYAKAEGYIIVSKDNDFRQRSFLFGFPPKVIWLSVGNSGTKIIANCLLKNSEKIRIFANSSVDGLLVLNTSSGARP